MSYRNRRGSGYVVPSYQALDGAPWYHFLHGNVPGHEIDFIYRPDVPQGPLTEQHFSHLARLMRDIEPPASGPYAFAVGNLSRDDTQHEPGHGGVALLFGLRIHGALDHAGRNDPPFAHAIAAIDRELDPAILLDSASLFRQRVLGATGPSGWYRDYVRCATEGPLAARRTLESYVKRFEDLPPPKPSTMGLKWTSTGARLPRRVVIVHDDDASFEAIAGCAAKIAAMLYHSDLRWTSITNGREADLPNGISIRFVAQRDFAPDSAENVHRITEIPEEEAEIARQIFDARAPAPEERPALQGWRERYPGKRVGSPGDPAADAPRPSEKDPASTPRLDEEHLARSSSPEPVPATTAEVTASLHGDPEATLLMNPGAGPVDGEAPDDLSTDCAGVDSIAPEPAARNSPVPPVDGERDHLDDAPLATTRSRRLLVGSALAGSALIVALAMAAVRSTVPQAPPAPPELGPAALAAPPLAIAPPPPVDTASTRANTPAPTANAPAPTSRATGKSPLIKPPRSTKRVKSSSGSAPGSAGQHPPTQGAADQPPVSLVPAPQSKEGATPAPSVFGDPR